MARGRSCLRPNGLGLSLDRDERRQRTRLRRQAAIEGIDF
jgi:hypothetical protein